MNIHEAFLNGAAHPAFMILFMILTMYLILLYDAHQDKRSRRVRIWILFCLSVTAAVLYLIILNIMWFFKEAREVVLLPEAIIALRAIPLERFIFFEILDVLALAASYYSRIRYRKTHPTFVSIKDTMDMLPAGLAFGEDDGTIVFSNLAINRMTEKLTGKRLKNMNDLFSKPGKQISPGTTQIYLPDGSEVWQMDLQRIPVSREEFLQLTATDITRQAKIAEELEDKNSKLKEINFRLNVYNRQAERIIISRELLNARMTVHSEVGNVLLECRHYLKDRESFDEDTLLQALKNTNKYLLREYEEDDTQKDQLADALDMAEAIGIDVSITGTIPSEPHFRAILAAAVNECSTNAAKHGEGNLLMVHISILESEIIYTLKSIGKLSASPPKEEGGLLLLRTLVEKNNGTMKTESMPEFQVTITLSR